MEGGANPQSALASADKPTTQSTGAKPNGVGEKAAGTMNLMAPTDEVDYEGGDKENKDGSVQEDYRTKLPTSGDMKNLGTSPADGGANALPYNPATNMLVQQQ